MTLKSDEIKRLASAVGFSDCGITRAERLSDIFFPLQDWLAAGYEADMAYMGRNVEMRCDPRLLVEGARSIVSLIVAYKPDRRLEGKARIAQYAYGEDYHVRLKRMMYSLMAEIKEIDAGFMGRPFVDTAPISDRHWAVKAGLGWIGKNSLFFHPRHGSYCFLCEIVTTAEFDRYDSAKNDMPCGVCNRCVEACPNHAIVQLASGCYCVDANRCTSYNTIENRAEKLSGELDTRGFVFGCDICQQACPHNDNVMPSFILTDERKRQLESLPEAGEKEFAEITRHSALDRVGYRQWKRNVEKAAIT